MEQSNNENYQEPVDDLAGLPEETGPADYGTEGTPQGQPEDYNFTYPEGYSEDDYGSAVVNEIKRMTHQIGQTPEQAQATMDNYIHLRNLEEQYKDQQYSKEYSGMREQMILGNMNTHEAKRQVNEGINMLDVDEGRTREFLKRTGYQDNYAIRKAFQAYAILNSQGRGTMERGTTSAPRTSTLEDEWDAFNQEPVYLKD